ncbi:MAG: CrcB family protein [Actinomycetales bacterium]|nr:CrcB family protein [Actinomycetales bacterium]
MTPALFLVVVAAGALGALGRYAITQLFAHPRIELPWAVFVVNVVGALLGGALLGLAQAGGVDPAVRSVLFAGFAGGFTTFSTLSVETIQLVRQGRMRIAALSVAGNLVVGLAATALGLLLGLALG